ncbi:MAG TPA: hypothetical protein PLO78_00775 [Candidatus Omnitrophota bacterium]|nr:hypothetical protein [Candidatus Omnitrophota bacterium]
MKNPRVASLFSILLPGLGQLYLKDYAKGWTLICIDIGIFVSLWISHSWFACVLLAVVYLGIMIPAAIDAFQNATGRPRVFTGESIPYVLWMLFAVGPFAIPLLWQSQKFSRRAKSGWTIFVILIALLMIATLNWMASFLNALMQQNSGG